MPVLSASPTGRAAAGRLSGFVALVLAIGALSGCAMLQERWQSLFGDKNEPYEGVVWADQRGRWELSPDEKPLEMGNVAEEAWLAERGAISVMLKASPDLNVYHGKPHTLLVRIYQVASPGSVTGTLDSGLGLRRLLTSEQVDPNILAATRLILEPGTEQVLVFDRAALAKHMVIVTGYSELDPQGSVRVIPFPGLRDYPMGWAQIKPENWTATINKYNPWGTPPPARPAKLDIRLRLGADKIDQVEARAR